VFFVKANKGLGVLLLLLVMTTAKAAPTIGNRNGNFVVRAVSPASNPHISVVADVTDAIESDNSRLAQLAVELLSPPNPYIDSTTTKSLPPVPGALLMVVTGFLCVSLVKDHKLWLTAVAGLFWVGQSGIHAVPQLAMRLGHRMHNHSQVAAGLMYPYYLENSRQRSDMEGTQYIGLLRHLAGIPRGKMPFLCNQYSRHAENEVRAPRCALVEISSRTIPVINCLTLKAGQFICFSPAFIFENLPRGPPKTT
jgi:hypothetical protein